MEETKQALVFVDVRNPRLIGTWDDLGEGIHIPGPLNPGWGYSKRWGDSRDWDDGDAAWEGSMSESKAEYYAKHLEQQWDETRDWRFCDTCGSFHHPTKIHPPHLGIPSEPRPVETVQPTGLPTLLARMAIEYEATLLPNGTTPHPHSDALVEDFNRILLSAAQPFLAEYLTAITTPPLLVVKEQQEEDEANLPIMVRTPLVTEREMSQQERIEIERGKRR